MGKSIIVILWLLVFTLLGAVGLELVLRLEPRKILHSAPPTIYEGLKKAYVPFSVQHINPHYLFFFDFDLEKRREINNDVCTVNEEGFRGESPKQAGKRKLAFLLGGSAAFGHYASSDATTITGYLNQMQQEYFFVNAGVPSWNSTQELYRLVHQLLEYNPSLVMTYDGANDIKIMARYYRQGTVYPVGTPDGFAKLYSLVDDIRAEKGKTNSLQQVAQRFFPKLSYLFDYAKRRIIGQRDEQKNKADVPEEIDALVDRIAHKYVYNLSLMQDVARVRNCRFIGIFQPMRSLHRNVPPQFKDREYTVFYQRFHRLVFEKYTPVFEYHDFSNVFDPDSENITWFDEKSQQDLTDTTAFVDEVHLYDYGNRLVAQKILSFL